MEELNIKETELKDNNFMKFDKDTNHKYHTILNGLKGMFIKSLEKALKLVPKKEIVDNIDKCDNQFTKDLYHAYDTAELKWRKWLCQHSRNKRKYEPNKDLKSRTIKYSRILRTAFMTILKHEANYQIFLAFIIDEYNKTKNGKR